MSSEYCSQPGLFDCVHNFVVAGANNELTEEHWSDFEQLLQENDDAFRLYIQYMEQSDLIAGRNGCNAGRRLSIP